MLETDRIQLPKDAPLQHVLSHSVTPHIVDGTPLGDAIGIGIQCLDFGQGYWSVVRARLVPSSTHLPPSLSVALLDEMPVRIAPTQTRILPLRLCISSLERISEDVKQLDVELTCVLSMALSQRSPEQVPSHARDDTEPITQSTFVLQTVLPLTHVPLWTQEKHLPVQASYFFAKSMPTVFSVKPPKEAFCDSQPKAVLQRRDGTHTSKCRGNEPILALRKFNSRLDTMVLNTYLTGSRWRWCRHPRPVILGGLASTARARMGRYAPGSDRLGEPVPASHCIL